MKSKERKRKESNQKNPSEYIFLNETICLNCKILSQEFDFVLFHFFFAAEIEKKEHKKNQNDVIYNCFKHSKLNKIKNKKQTNYGKIYPNLEHKLKCK